MRTDGVNVEDFEGPRYKRLAHLKSLITSGVIDAELRVAKKQAVGMPSLRSGESA
jgi:hypothetical protein